MVRKLIYSAVKNAQDKNPIKGEASWSVFVKKFAKPEARGSMTLKKYLACKNDSKRKHDADKQKNGTAIIPGEFAKQCTRCKADLKSRYLLVLDLDDGNYTFRQLVKSLKDYECIIHTSYSHSAECGKFRAYIPFDKPVTNNIEETCSLMLDYFEKILGEHIDKKCWNASQIYFTPSCPPDAVGLYQFIHIKGKPIRTANFNPPIIDNEQIKTVIEPSGHRPGDDYNQRGSWKDLLTDLGWSHFFTNKQGDAYWTRPGKTKSISAVVFRDSNLFYSHSSASEVAPFEANKAYTLFAAYALIKHKNDFAAAAKQLKADGYGESSAEFSSEQTAAVCPVLHENALPGWLGEFVRLACEHSEAHEAATLITLLLRFAAEILEPYFNVGDSKHQARTNAVIVGLSAKARKGTSSKPVDRLFDGLENSATFSPGPLSSGEGLIYAVRDATLEFDKKTKELVVVDPGVSDKRLFVQDEEFAAALTCTKREGNTLSAIIRGFFDGGNAEPLTKSNKIKATGAHVVIVAHITMADLSSLLNSVQIANGFANRFMWFLVHRKKLVAMPKAIPAKEIHKYQRILSRRIEAARRLDSVEMSEKALEYWEDMYPALSMDYTGAAGSVAGRSETHAIRLALIYALAAGRSKIIVEDLKAALALVAYSKESVFAIFKGNSGDKRKEKIIEGLRKAPGKEMTRSDIYKVLKNNANAVEIDKMLQELESSKLIELVKIETKRKPKSIVRLANV